MSGAAPNLLLFAAVPHVGAGFVALAVSFPPLLTYVAALVLRLERFDVVRAAGVTLALAGAVTLAALKIGEPSVDVRWVVAVLVAPLLLAIGDVYRTVRWPPGAAPDALAPTMLAASALLLLLVGAAATVSSAGMGTLSLNVPLERLAPLVLITVQGVTFAVQYLLFFELQQRGGPVYLSLLGSVGALVGIPVAVLASLCVEPSRGKLGSSLPLEPTSLLARRVLQDRGLNPGWLETLSIRRNSI